ncbi:serine hydrolase domain-containing protein [Guptibacillus hwajinpoensis]|uniref:serine hydrolase domain-containing protein n=1 Tax=Guptibacillus hwajinpoensis TaxID=208199 RepID=UPI001CFF07B6|nr:serine hydrolase domain-containing protein [Pseudalkalibacillus hwajinpoensis]WLR58852.1 serine hydrolase domain-containing protein [Pseudalkalibacillus hwajinpoensis]
MTEHIKLKKLEELFSFLTKEKMFNGSVLVSENGSLIYDNVNGLAAIDQGKKLSEDSRFDIASFSKSFTAMAIMILKEEQKLNFEDALEKHLPELPLPYQGITIRNLLTHTSGLPDYIDWFEENWDRKKIASNKEVLELFLKEHQPSLLFEPGDNWEYSNTGYILLAEVVKKVSGLTFEEFLKSYIFSPLGMNHTQLLSRRINKESLELAEGYIYDRVNDEYHIPDHMDEHSYVYFIDGVRGDGVINTTAEDLYKWEQALYTNVLVTINTKNEAFKPAVLTNGKSLGYSVGLHPDGEAGYGFGWSIENNSNTGKILSHGGYCAGFHSFVIRYVDSNKSIIYLSNIDYLEFEDNKLHHDIVLQIENILFDKEVKLPSFPVKNNSSS